MNDKMTGHQLETYKSLITISTESFKYLALVNGGAVVVLLSYMGNAIGKAAAPDMRYAIACFITGLVCCGAGLGCAYLTQLALFNEGEKRAPPLGIPHQTFLTVAVISYLGSLLAFGIGAWAAVSRFGGYG